MANPKASVIKRVGRAIKLQYLKLLRSPGGARKVATGFAIGFGIEFMVICTAMLVYIVFYPLVRAARGSMPAALIGHVIAKMTLLPIPMLGVGLWIGKHLLPFRIHMPHWMPYWLAYFLNHQLKTIVGMTLISVVMGALTYPVAYYLYELNRKRRAAKLANRKYMRVQNNGSQP
ncbi:DUF2062 domain-containing protein [Effusibacillus pohliae]|uniref:DUF2062 domain-containing protein n=1 Tax=Effusibacillus pohliae TaxID=232270 RepID=UPI00037598E7|nr:DUF2062 domain-containing protein [Effusibacillus pohliae]